MEIPKTEGIKYAGSKLKLLPYIFEMVDKLDNVETVLDGSVDLPEFRKHLLN